MLQDRSTPLTPKTDYWPTFQTMEAQKKGQDVILIPNKYVGGAFRKACEHDTNGDAVLLARAVNIVRRVMFKMKKQFEVLLNPTAREILFQCLC